MEYPSEDFKPKKYIGHLIINDTSTSNEFKAMVHQKENGVLKKNLNDMRLRKT